MAAAAVAAGFRSRVVGQRAIRARLADALRGKRAAHAYLFSGPRGVGKTAVALEFAALLLCEQNGTEPCGNCAQCAPSLALQHPDLHIVFALPPKKKDSPEEDEGDYARYISDQTMSLAKDPYISLKIPAVKSRQPDNDNDSPASSSKTKSTKPKSQTLEIRIKSIRTLLHRAAMKPYQAACKVLVVLNADTMNAQTQNCLLKALEEPYPDAYFILTTENEGGLLQTIRSRCQRMRFTPLSVTDIREALTASGMPESQAELAAAMSGGSYSHARELAKDDLQDLQQRVIAFLRAAAVCDPMELPKAVAAMLGDGTQPDPTALEFLGLFLRDVALHAPFQNTAVPPATFRGFEDRIEAVLSSYPAADFAAAAQAVDVAGEHLERGYTKDYVMLGLAIRLHEALGPRASVKTKPAKIEHA
jgi:DNA polymerase III subunit delta'